MTRKPPMKKGEKFDFSEFEKYHPTEKESEEIESSIEFTSNLGLKKPKSTKYSVKSKIRNLIK